MPVRIEEHVDSNLTNSGVRSRFSGDFPNGGFVTFWNEALFIADRARELEIALADAGCDVNNEGPRLVGFEIYATDRLPSFDTKPETDAQIVGRLRQRREDMQRLNGFAESTQYTGMTRYVASHRGKIYGGETLSEFRQVMADHRIPVGCVSGRINSVGELTLYP